MVGDKKIVGQEIKAPLHMERGFQVISIPFSA